MDSRLVSICRAEEPDDKIIRKPKSGTWLTAREAPGQLALARALHMVEYEQHVASFLGKHAHDVDTASLDPCMAAVLRGACRLRRAAP